MGSFTAVKTEELCIELQQAVARERGGVVQGPETWRDSYLLYSQNKPNADANEMEETAVSVLEVLVDEKEVVQTNSSRHFLHHSGTRQRGCFRQEKPPSAKHNAKETPKRLSTAIVSIALQTAGGELPLFLIIQGHLGASIPRRWISTASATRSAT